MEWLNRLDYELPEVDVTDDYDTEHAQVMKAGRCSQFTPQWINKPNNQTLLNPGSPHPPTKRAEAHLLD